MRFHLYLPQMRTSFEDLVDRAKRAEAAGFEGMALMDHLAPPLAEHQPMYEAMTAATWLAARTTTLRLGHLVLCDAVREPAVLARQAVSIDHASGGRFELGLGWGSVPAELVAFGITDDGPAARLRRLVETITVIKALWRGEPVDHDGEFHQLRGACQQPPPLGTIPLVVGGAGPRTVRLAAAEADWWNLPSYDHDRFDELAAAAAPARPSILQVVAYVHPGASHDEVAELATRRFGAMGELVVGDGSRLRDHFAGLGERGARRAYVWFADFAAPATLAAFGAEVVAPLAAAEV